MIKHTFLKKCCTIVKDSKTNTGLNPVAELNAGAVVSRALIYFDENELKKLVNDKTFADTSKLRHILKLTNCGSINNPTFRKKLFSEAGGDKKERATSFDVVIFPVYEKWDEGRGFNHVQDYWTISPRGYSEDGCTWFSPVTAKDWDEDSGVYSSDTIQREIVKWNNKEETIILTKQHFDYGNENFELDITDYVNDVLMGKRENFGLGLAFSPDYENISDENIKYVGFFTHRTNTFFEPYLETIYDEAISDDRSCFYLNKTNRLYFYANINGEPHNLDELPVCTIDDETYPVKQVSKGVYCAEITLLSSSVRPNTILYDTWSNLALNGLKMDDVEMEFVTLDPKGYYSLGNGTENKKKTIPSFNGINLNEKLEVGEVRELTIDFRVPYTTDKRELIDGAEWRLYVKDNLDEINVFEYHPIEKGYLHNFVIINTNDLVHGRYFIDLKVKNGRNINYFRECFKFEVVSNITELYK